MTPVRNASKHRPSPCSVLVYQGNRNVFHGARTQYQTIADMFVPVVSPGFSLVQTMMTDRQTDTVKNPLVEASLQDGLIRFHIKVLLVNARFFLLECTIHTAQLVQYTQHTLYNTHCTLFNIYGTPCAIYTAKCVQYAQPIL